MLLLSVEFSSASISLAFVITHQLIIENVVQLCLCLKSFFIILFAFYPDLASVYRQVNHAISLQLSQYHHLIQLCLIIDFESCLICWYLPQSNFMIFQYLPTKHQSETLKFQVIYIFSNFLSFLQQAQQTYSSNHFILSIFFTSFIFFSLTSFLSSDLAQIQNFIKWFVHIEHSYRFIILSLQPEVFIEVDAAFLEYPNRFLNSRIQSYYAPETSLQINSGVPNLFFLDHYTKIKAWNFFTQAPNLPFVFFVFTLSSLQSAFQSKPHTDDLFNLICVQIILHFFQIHQLHWNIQSVIFGISQKTASCSILINFYATLLVFQGYFYDHLQATIFTNLTSNSFSANIRFFFSDPPLPSLFLSNNSLLQLITLLTLTDSPSRLFQYSFISFFYRFTNQDQTTFQDSLISVQTSIPVSTFASQAFVLILLPNFLTFEQFNFSIVSQTPFPNINHQQFVQFFLCLHLSYHFSTFFTNQYSFIELSCTLLFHLHNLKISSCNHEKDKVQSLDLHEYQFCKIRDVQNEPMNYRLATITNQTNLKAINRLEQFQSSYQQIQLQVYYLPINQQHEHQQLEIPQPKIDTYFSRQSKTFRQSLQQTKFSPTLSFIILKVFQSHRQLSYRQKAPDGRMLFLIDKVFQQFLVKRNKRHIRYGKLQLYTNHHQIHIFLGHLKLMKIANQIIIHELFNSKLNRTQIYATSHLQSGNDPHLHILLYGNSEVAFILIEPVHLKLCKIS